MERTPIELQPVSRHIEDDREIKMDTHMHSKASDGMWRPEEVVQFAKEQGLHVIALTDHDTIFGVPAAIEEGEKIGVKVIPGIEIDSDYKKDEITVSDLELLGLNINLEKMKVFAQERADSRIESLQSYIDAFNVYITSSEFEERNAMMRYPLVNVQSLTMQDIIKWRSEKDKYENPYPFLSKMDIVWYLLQHHVEPTEATKKALAGDRVYSGEFKSDYNFLFEGKEKKPTFYESIQAVKESGGKAVLAHPGLSKGYLGGMIKGWQKPKEQWYTDDEGEFTPYHFVKDLVAHGLDGVELYFYRGNDKAHEDEQELINEYFAGLAKKLNIITTCGSDCHGERGKGPNLGKFGSDQIYTEHLDCDSEIMED